MPVTAPTPQTRSPRAAATPPPTEPFQRDPAAAAGWAATLDHDRTQAILWSLAVPLGATLACDLLFPTREPTNYLIVYLIGVLFVASRFGFWPSAISAALSVLASDFLLIKPYFSFAVARPQDVLTLAVFVLAALVASRLTANLRTRGEEARLREQRMRFLYEFTRAMSGVRTEEEVGEIASRQIARDSAWRCRLLLADIKGRLLRGNEDPRFAPPEFNAPVAQWAYDQRRAAGAGTDAYADRVEQYLPVSGAAQCYGVLVLRPPRGDPRALRGQRQWIETVLGLVSQAIERIRLAREVQAANVQAETEALRNSLLSAIAHDLRTPLASIVGAAGTLMQDAGRLNKEQLHELSRTIHDEGLRMSQLADNTLEMARLEAGAVRPQRDWYPVEEIVGAVLTRMDERLAGHPVHTHLPGGVALTQVDAVMIVRVLENLLENAGKYTPPGTALEVVAEELPGLMRFRVGDRGPGLAAGEEQRIFEKFVRGSAPSSRGGVGLGLAICRIIVEAHGGQILARNRAGGGAEFVFTVPQTEEPPQVDAAAEPTPP